MSAKVEISFGELFDKVSILEIKASRVADPAKRRNVARELAQLVAVCLRIPGGDGIPSRVLSELKSVNEQLWDVEDALRSCESRQSFGPAFVDLARSVYRLNDRRAALKREINLALGSALVEEKLHPDY
jgi:hypothetical protein